MTAFVLRVATSGPGLVGSFEPQLSGWLDTIIIDVTGAPQGDGSVLFTGKQDPINGDLFAYEYEVQRLVVRLDLAAGLVGEVSVRGTYPTPGHDRSATGAILSASYQADVSVPGANFLGSWTGLFVIRACSGYCPAYQTVGSTDRIDLALNQSRGSVAGELRMSSFYCGTCWLPISGSVSGSQAALSSETITRNPPDGIGDKTMHLESFNATMDSLGRVTGRFVYSSVTRNYGTPSDVSYRIEGEVLWLTRSWPASSR